MRFTNFTSVLALVPSALASSMTLAWNTKTDCSGSQGKFYHYNANECHTLGKNDWAVDIWFTGSPCTLYAYEADDCTGNRAVLEKPHDAGDVCHSLQGRWSVMVSDC
ncbi:hypothetical protein GGR51DRAFT_516794 [Nemania sp. FL0031]|nr:hypothetical protein GGR51DRAFT_516794 [Nemania sp. FL0031]